MYEVSAFTVKVEAVTHALLWIASRGVGQTTHAIILTDSTILLKKKKKRGGGGNGKLRLAYRCQ